MISDKKVTNGMHSELPIYSEPGKLYKLATYGIIRRCMLDHEWIEVLWEAYDG